MRVFVGALAVVAGWYAWQRATAGNAYATPLPDQTEDFFSWDIMNDTPTQQLRYFTASEFGEWWPDMSTELLQKLDEFRHRLGVPVTISPATGSLGRHLGTALSQHNVDMWGEVRAADVMIPFTVDLQHAYQIAKEVGFSGIGLYPDWQPMHGLHLDVRQAPLALWSGIKEGGQQVYKSITAAFS